MKYNFFWIKKVNKDIINKDTKIEKRKLHCYKNPVLFRRYEY